MTIRQAVPAWIQTSPTLLDEYVTRIVFFAWGFLEARKACR